MDVDAIVTDLERRFGISAHAARLVAAALRASQPGTATDSTMGALETTAPSIVPHLAPIVPTPAAPAAGPRYTDLGLIGLGGMGEVRRVRDERLGRVVAMKRLRAELKAVAAVSARFREEAQIGAQLQHPGIPPVYDAGEEDGAVWFTMEEVRGRTLGEAIDEVHAASEDGTWRAGSSGVTFARLVDAFATVCEAVGYAHARGVMHRDLKPANVMLGDHGEVLVIDWGLARPIRGGRSSEPWDAVVTARSADASQHTRVGAVAGTPAYMPLEQARGDVERLDARADVYALGAILYQILAGRAPYRGATGAEVLAKVLTELPEPLGNERPLPEDLVRVCAKAMAREPEGRPVDGSALAAEVRAWLEGARRRERALEMVGQADALGPQITERRTHAGELRGQAQAILAAVAPHEVEARKSPGWDKEDEASRLDAEARMLGVRAETLLHGALAYDPDLREAHAALAARYVDAHAAAESDRDDARAADAALRLESHLERLPATHPQRVRASAYLRGDGALTLVTEPPGAQVELSRYVLRGRRLVPVFERELGRTPLVEVPLAIGSYVARLRAEGRADVWYPIEICRGERWHGVPPGGSRPQPIVLPEHLGPDDVAVPAGWFRSGGDPGATGALPARRLWCDPFVMRRFPVSNRAWLAFLNDLVASGNEADALLAAPRERGGEDGRPGALMYGRSADGGFTLDGPRPFGPDHPAVMIDFTGARLYAAWEARRTGLPWRLPGELEWEKAARGVDGRIFPWGDFLDPSWCCLWDSHVGAPAIAPNDSFPVDASPYGVRGLGGNVRDWCADVWRPEGPPVEGDRFRVVAEGALDVYRARRGGSWGDMAGRARTADRDWYAPSYRYDYLSVRLVRSIP